MHINIYVLCGSSIYITIYIDILVIKVLERVSELNKIYMLFVLVSSLRLKVRVTPALFISSILVYSLLARGWEVEVTQV